MDINDLAEFFEDRMTMAKASDIITKWNDKPKADWVEKHSQEELQLDGYFTADELEAFAFCMKRDISIMGLIQVKSNASS